MALVAVDIDVVAIFLRHTQIVPSVRHTVVLAGVEIHAQRNRNRSCLSGHLLQRDAGRRHRVATEIKIVCRTVRQYQVGRKAVDMHKSPRALFESGGAVLHPEACTRRFGSIDTHLVMTGETGMDINWDITNIDYNIINISIKIATPICV